MFNSQTADNYGFKGFCIIGFIISFLTVFLPITSFAKDYSFSWTANAASVEGYRLYYKKGGSAGPPFDGYDAYEGPSPIDIGDQTSFTISGLEDNTTYHFALTAYSWDDESDFTDIITVFPNNNKQRRVKEVLNIINSYLLLREE